MIQNLWETAKAVIRGKFYSNTTNLISENKKKISNKQQSLHIKQLEKKQWTKLKVSRLPQGFKDHPHIFGNVLAQDLRGLKLINGAILQCVDDLLIVNSSKKEHQMKKLLKLQFICGKKSMQHQNLK